MTMLLSKHQHKNNRYYAQLALQLETATGDAKEYIYGLSGLSNRVSQEDAVRLALSLPVETKQYFPTPEIEKILRQEWTSDTINFVTIEKLVHTKAIEPPVERNLFGYVGKRSEEFEKMDSLKENDYNWEEDPNLSFEDKIAILEDSIDYNREEMKASRREAVFQKRLEVA